MSGPDCPQQRHVEALQYASRQRPRDGGLPRVSIASNLVAAGVVLYALLVPRVYSGPPPESSLSECLSNPFLLVLLASASAGLVDLIRHRRNAPRWLTIWTLITCLIVFIGVWL
mgnify:FL=1